LEECVDEELRLPSEPRRGAREKKLSWAGSWGAGLRERS
jgi:hypothetical protein